MGKLSSSEKNYPYAWRRVRGFAFVSNFTEISSVVEWDLLNIKKLSAYVFAGVGATIFNPKTDFNEPNPYINSDFNPDAKAHFKKITPAIPIGGGLKYHFTPNLCLSVEMGSRILFTDYIDGISILGNPKRRDTYFVTATTLTKTWGSSKSSANRSYRLGRNICPTF